MSEPEPSERMAELMAWHGMARYADPDDLVGHLRSSEGPVGRVSTTAEDVPHRE